MNSTFGKNLKITVGGGSHEKYMYACISNLPMHTDIAMCEVFDLLKDRQGGTSAYVTSRKEDDIPYIVDDRSIHNADKLETFLKNTTSILDVSSCHELMYNDIVNTEDSGHLNFVIINKNYNSSHYDITKPRPGHADLPAYIKHHDNINLNGGSAYSGRMTAMLCIVGGIALNLLKKANINIDARITQIGNVLAPPLNKLHPITTPITHEMVNAILEAKNLDDSIGGSIEVFAINVPCGLGDSMYDGLESYMSPIFFGIPGVKALEFGSGFEACNKYGSDNNDDFLRVTSTASEQKHILHYIQTSTNNHGGILGGISTGMPIVAHIGLKPTPSIARTQHTIDINTNEPVDLEITGRHDPCIAPRALPVCKAAMAVGLLDAIIAEPNSAIYDIIFHTSQTKTNCTYHGKNFANEDVNCNNDTMNVCNTITNVENDKSDATDTLLTLRNDIDNIDNEIIRLLNARLKLCKDVGVYKSRNNIEITDNSRENEILVRIPSEYHNIYKEIFKFSKMLQLNL